VPKTFTTRRERQRIEHLVMGQPRPKARRGTKRVRGEAIDPDIAAAIQRREDWSHKHDGTPETHAHAQAARRRTGTLMRLHASGAIDDSQLAAAEFIATIFEMLATPVSVKVASWGPRGTATPGSVSHESDWRIDIERRYSIWRQRQGVHAAMVLSILIDDITLSHAARRWRHSLRSTRLILHDALNDWFRC
jgi:hypothetical protein